MGVMRTLALSVEQMLISIEIIINFIGTYTLFDWSNNYSYVIGKYKDTKRFKRAMEAFLKITDDYPNYKVVLVGHSQSAVITNLLNRDFPNRIYEVINLNGAKISRNKTNARKALLCC
jgi:pimeloyl-ACP methyl ester carboxylesterase